MTTPTSSSSDAEATIRHMMETADQQSFCDLLLMSCTHGQDIDEALSLLHEPWVLKRLRAIHAEAPHIYYGTFLGPLRRKYPHQVFPRDIMESMRGVDALLDGKLGDVAPDLFLEAMRQHYETGEVCGASPGWASLAQLYTVAPGETTVITGTSNAMKSTFVQALAVNLARQFGWQFGVFAGEHGRPGKFGRHVQEAYVNMRQVEMPEEMFTETAAWVTRQFHPIIAPEEVPMSVPWLLTVARTQVKTYGIKGLIVDPWNKLEHQRGYENETDYIGRMLSRLMNFGIQHDVHVFIVAHPTKVKRAESGPYKGLTPPPTPYDISGSAHWYNMPDNALSIWRDVSADSHEIEVHVQKVRNYINGHIGMCPLTLEGFRFVERATHDEEERWEY